MILTLVILMSCAQTTEQTESTKDNPKTEETQEDEAETSVVYRTISVTFETIFDIETETKDGFYVEGYIVHLDYHKALDINGKKVKISGEITKVSGLDNTQQEYDEDGNEIIMQGRSGDTSHIFDPKIEVLE